MVEHRQPKPTVDFIDEYCSHYRNLFCDVRSFEAFKYLHMGMLSEIKRKTLPAIAKVVGLENHQQLHHFLTNSPWEASKLRQARLELILKILSGRPIVLDELELKYLVAIRSNHHTWMPPNKRVQYLKWRRFKRVFSDLTREDRYIREIICGKRREIRYWQITTDPEELPSNTTWYVMSKYPEITPREVGNFYGLRTWVEYGLKQSKNRPLAKVQ